MTHIYPTYLRALAILLGPTVLFVYQSNPTVLFVYQSSPCEVKCNGCWPFSIGDINKVLPLYTENKHGIYSPFFPLQNAVWFIIPTYLAPVLFTFYI